MSILLVFTRAAIIFFTILPGVHAAVDTTRFAGYREINLFFDENESCFTCHGESRYKVTDPFTGRVVTQLMCSNRIVNREEYYASNHKTFTCFDCHSRDFETFPHPMEPRMETPYTCLDCHGYDENYASYQFEKIEEEYLVSTHHQFSPEEFSCWKCHNPHSYRISMRNSTNLRMTIAYDNDICLSCHSNFDRFRLLTDHEGIDIIRQHDWLPNQALHFKNVRCIECHTRISEDLLIAHEVKPREEAVRRCSECHSSNSMLLSTLYKFRAKESRNELGFINGVILNESYVIGATRNYFLNLSSIIIFGLTLCGIGIHIIYRIIKKV